MKVIFFCFPFYNFFLFFFATNSHYSVFQGDCAIFSSDTFEKKEMPLKVLYGEKVIFPIHTATGTVILIPIASSDSPGKKKIIFFFPHTTVKKTLWVKKKKFPFQSITTTKHSHHKKRKGVPQTLPTIPNCGTKKRKKSSSTTRESFQNRYHSYLAQHHTKHSTITPFALQKPCRILRRSSPFGALREVNGVCSRHNGCDLVGTPHESVVAAEQGTIAIKGTFPITGNTIVLDHGGGICTVYFHLATLPSKREGEAIARGETIGTIGKTGRATNYHLHFGIAIQGTWVNPEEWLSHK